MPFGKWTVEPVLLGQDLKFPSDVKARDCDFDTVTNAVLVKCLHQLGSILEHADRIFDEVSADCRIIYERSERLKSKMLEVQDVVANMNARAVKVPVSDLNASRKLVKRSAPYRIQYDHSIQLFLPSNRPPCIDKLYSEAYQTPVSLMCTIDPFRNDGCTSSELFMVTPVLGGTRKKKKKMLDIETRKPANFTLARSAQEDSECGPFLVSPSVGVEDRLPSPEEQTLATSLAYPSSVVSVDVSGSGFVRMTSCRRSLLHADFEIKRKKNKHKRRHTVCEVNNKELDQALQNITTMVNNSCQTEDLTESNSFFSFRRSFSRRKRSADATRRETIALDGLNLDFGKKDSDTGTSDRSCKKESQPAQSKKSGKGFFSAKASSLSAAITMAVKMRHSKSNKHDDGRSSSGNWSASSSNRASLDSDHHLAMMVSVDRNSNVSRSSVGKDSVLSDATTGTTTTTQHEPIRQQEQHDKGIRESQKLKSAKMTGGNATWVNDRNRGSNASTPERASECAITPLVRSPYNHRRGHANYYAVTTLDDGESSVYSVDTDGYYTSMHTDSGLWNVINSLKNGDNQSDSIRCRRRQESQSSVSTIGNGSINSFLSKIVTENDNSSTCSSVKEQKLAPEPPPRFTSSLTEEQPQDEKPQNVKTIPVAKFEKENTPTKNGSASESDYESRDRIRVKTTINSSRYPSLCTVSPETSDDELHAMREKETSSKSIVVAEVHRSEMQEDKSTTTNIRKPLFASENGKVAQNVQRGGQTINMYGNQSPTESSFSSSLLSNANTLTSTPKKCSTVSSFTSDPVEPNREQWSSSPSMIQKLVSDLKNIPKPSIDMVCPSPPPCPKPEPERKKDETLIPLKYTQRIMVTPIMKTESIESAKNPSVARTKSFLKNPLTTLSFRNAENMSPKPKSPSYISFQSPDSPVSSSSSLTPEITTSTLPSQKAVARVTLDPMGKVIFSTSSLERNRNLDVNDNSKNTEQKYATLPKYETSPSQLKQTIPPMTKMKVGEKETYNCIKQDLPGNEDIAPLCLPEPMSTDSSKFQSLMFRPSRGGRFCRTYFPSHIISPVTGSSSSTIAPSSSNPTKPSRFSTTNFLNRRNFTPSNVSPVSRNFSSKTQSDTSPVGVNLPFIAISKQKEQFMLGHQSNHQSPSSHFSSSDYHFRPVTPQESPSLNRYTRQSPKFTAQQTSSNNNGDSALLSSSVKALRTTSPSILSKYSSYQPKFLNKLAEFTPPNPPDVIPSSSTPPSTLDIITARTNKERIPNCKSPSETSSLKSLSSQELFAIIHDSKKKHNIKTGSEKSLSPMSSRSSSPGIAMTPSPVKTQRIETGILSRQANQPSPRPAENASDRLGKSKPTSMHDFKMLLLQARTPESSPRPTAAELLKVSPPRSQGHSSPKTLPRISHQKSQSPTMQKREPTHVSTVPVKRMARTRSPFLTRYDSTYPPIWEDCSEDLEATDENRNTSLRSNGNVYSKSMSFSNSLLDNEKSKGTSTWV